jgi:3-phosphoshikimate 1-carboxyvinyltransferase
MAAAVLRVRRGRTLEGAFRPPGDKSITHRAVLFGLLAEGETRVTAGNPGEDCGRSWQAASALGGSWRDEPAGRVLRGTAMGLRAPATALECGNSGTTMRLLCGIAAGRVPATLQGDASLSRRPMGRVLEPLRNMGAHIEAAAGDRPPVRIESGDLRGMHHDIPVASAQVATCLLLAGLSASGRTSVTLPGAARDHTERMLPAFGIALEVEAHRHGGRTVRIEGGAVPRGTALIVPGDFSGAAFFLAAAASTPGAQVTAEGVTLNPTRTGLLDVILAMGGEVVVARTREEAGEPVGDVTVRGPDRLRAFDVPAEWMPRLIDEAPAWVLLASAADGVSRLSGAGELRVKESDRIALMARNLTACGIVAHEHADGIEVRGGEARGARIESALDHRMVMAFAALGARTTDGMVFDDVSSVLTSYPGFFGTLSALGAQVGEERS